VLGGWIGGQGVPGYKDFRLAAERRAVLVAPMPALAADFGASVADTAVAITATAPTAMLETTSASAESRRCLLFGLIQPDLEPVITNQSAHSELRLASAWYVSSVQDDVQDDAFTHNLVAFIQLTLVGHSPRACRT
jgi:hypothetical protein